MGSRASAAARHYCRPPKGLGDWSVARHVFHMLDYERQIAVPVMQQWLGAPPAVVGWEEEASWQANCRFRPSRSSWKNSGPCASSRLLCSPDWGAHLARAANDGLGTGPVVLGGSKTYQHTNEHTSDVLCMALNWDYYAAREQAGG